MTKKPNLADITKVTAGKTKTTGISPFSELEISKVYPNPDQPRKQFDDIEELAATIKEHGLLQPITVVKKDDRYMIISGERRYKAHLHNESKTIKAYILDKTDEQIEELALIENIQRNDLTDYETAKGVVKLWESGRYEKKSDLATKLGKKDSYISKAFNTLKLDTSIIEDIEQNNSDISLSVIDEIARVKDPVVQKEVYEKYSSGEITRDEIKDFKEPKKQKQIEEKIEEFETPVACNYVKEENFPWEKTFSEQYFYVKDFEKQLTQAFKDGDRQPFKKIKMNNAYEQKIHDLLLEQDTKYIDDHIDSINQCVKRNGYKENESGKIFLYAPGYHVKLRNRYGEIIFDLLKENLELKKEIEELKKSSNISQVQEPIEDAEPITIKSLELNDNDVTIEYSNNHHEYISYSKAKKIIKESTQEYIKYVNNGSENACKFIDSLPKNISIYGVYFKRDNGFY